MPYTYLNHFNIDSSALLCSKCERVYFFTVIAAVFLKKANMAAVRKHRRVAASQPGFLSLKSSTDGSALNIGRRKRVNKNKKKNWNKYSDIQDVEEFLEDVRLQERATG